MDKYYNKSIPSFDISDTCGTDVALSIPHSQQFLFLIFGNKFYISLVKLNFQINLL